MDGFENSTILPGKQSGAWRSQLFEDRRVQTWLANQVVFPPHLIATWTQIIWPCSLRLPSNMDLIPRKQMRQPHNTREFEPKSDQIS